MVGVTHPVRLIASSHCMLIASDCAECRWASRWDLYLYMGDDQIHWFSILNSLAIVLLLTGTRFGSDGL